MPKWTPEYRRAYENEWHRKNRHRMPSAQPAARAAQVRAWRERNREKINAQARAYKARNPEKALAHRLVREALKKGALVKGPCQNCGSTDGRIDAHHADYDKPLEVTWWCRRCHNLHHSPHAQHRPPAGGGR